MKADRNRAGKGLGLWPLIGLIGAGAALRLVSLDTRSFWLDETTAVRQATWPIPELIERMSDNVHPPLFHYLLHYWIRLFGSSEVAVRSFSVTWGILAIPLAYWAASVIYGRRSGLFAAGIVSLAPFFVWYSQEARMYTMMLVFALIAVGALWKAMESGLVRWWAVYAVAITAGIMTQYFAAFLVLAQGIYVAGFRSARRRQAASDLGHLEKRPHPVPEIWGWLGSLAFAALPLLWWAPKVLRHRDLFRGISGPFNYGGLPPVFGVHFNEQILVPVQWLFGFHSALTTRDLVAMWPLLITAAFILGGLGRRFTPPTVYLAVSGLGAASMISLLGFWQPIALEARYYTAAGVPFVILGGRLLAELRPRALAVVLVVAVSLGALSWTDQSYNPSNVVKWDNRAAMGIVADGYQPGDSVLLIPYFVSSIPQYYLPPDIYARIQPVPSFDPNDQPRNRPVQMAEDLTRKVGLADRVWVISTWQDVPRIALDRAITDAWLKSQGYRVIDDHRLHQIRVTLYGGRPTPDFLLDRGAPQVYVGAGR